MKTKSRIFPIKDFTKPSDGAPIRSVVTENPEAVIIVWHVKPGQEIAPHVHPAGQDTWIVQSGSAEYFLGKGERCTLKRGDVAVARPGEVHGAVNSGDEPFVFVSVVSPANAGFEVAGK